MRSTSQRPGRRMMSRLPSVIVVSAGLHTDFQASSPLLT